MQRERRCKCCGRDFIPPSRNSRYKYCSYECQQRVMISRKWYRRFGDVIVYCPVCNRKYFRDFKKFPRTIAYRCKECRDLGLEKPKKKQLVKARCIVCNSEFLTPHRRAPRFCSDACREIRKRALARLRAVMTIGKSLKAFAYLHRMPIYSEEVLRKWEEFRSSLKYNIAKQLHYALVSMPVQKGKPVKEWVVVGTREVKKRLRLRAKEGGVTNAQESATDGCYENSEDVTTT